MDMSGLSFDQAPPYHSVQRFFLTAPVFAMLSGFAIMINGQSIFLSFLNIKLIGITHGMTLGFFTMTMFGAMMQMLPVLAGVKIKFPVLFSTIIHAGLSTGAFLFGASFFFHNFIFLPYALILAGSSIVIFCVSILFKLFSVKNATPTIKAMILSVISLLFVLSLGVSMATWRLQWIEALKIDLLTVHLFWAFGGWITILIMGVSFQVIPMFYVAPEFPVYIKKYFPWTLFILLILYSLFSVLLTDLHYSLQIKKLIRLLMYMQLLIYSVATINLLGKRKRKLPDPSLLFWKTALFFLTVFALLAGFIEFYHDKYLSKLVLLSGILFAFGFINSMINAMLYKIVPFLSWFHLASRGIFEAPTMKDMLSDNKVKGQFYFHCIFVAVVILTVFSPRPLYFYTGMFLFLSGAFFWINLIQVVVKYNKINKLALLNKNT